MGLLEDQIRNLNDVIGGLESRIRRLEERRFGDSPKTPEAVRMILIGLALPAPVCPAPVVQLQAGLVR